jgi:integrase
MKHTGHDRHLGDTKTPKSVRTLNMPAAVVAALRDRQVEQEGERLNAAEFWHETALIFPTSIGKLAGLVEYRNSFKACTKAAGLGRGWTPYELRHTCVSLPADADVPIQHISGLVGHSSIRMTADVYPTPGQPLGVRRGLHDG